MNRAVFNFLSSVSLVFCVAASASAQVQEAGDNGGRKSARAVRVQSGTIDVDGRLDDSAWSSAPVITDFVLKEPVEGGQPTDAMEVRFAYDDTALYVGARMYSDAPIQAPMGRRDEGERAEHLLVSLDTYLDRRTAFTFGVTAAGVRIDSYYASDDQNDDDDGFDPVWRAGTSRDERGWTAELWIPFSQLRFTARSSQTWGLNVQRWVPSRNEEVFWSLVPRTERRWSSLFGDLLGIDGISPPRRIELLPYVASSSHLIGNRDLDDPFGGGANLVGRVGLDAKFGIGSNLTLEATINPDFGQVEADPAEVNLSAFETFFSERRPFFVEGSDLLTGQVNNYFYSRRIGAAPVGDADGDFVDYPATSTILGAAKLTGRLQSGLSVGVLGAVTAEESARTFNSGLFSDVAVAPRATYGVARLQQEFGEAGSTTAVMVTGVHRDLAQGSPLAALLPRAAFTLSSDSLLRMRGGDYELHLNGGTTYVKGDAPAIDRVQRGSVRYMQRPDATYVNYDPTRTSLSGMKAIASLERRNAEHWLWDVGVDFESPEMETNDVGRLNQGDGMVGQGRVEYRETVPRGWLRNYSFTLGTRNEWNYGGDRQQARLSPEARLEFLNFWEAEVNGEINIRSQNARLTRGGPSMEQPRNWQVEVQVSSSDASQTRGELSTTYGRNEDGGLTFQSEVELSMQPSPQLQFSVTPSYERQVDTQQYISALAGGSPLTYGTRYVFGDVDRSTFSTQFRMNYTFKPDLTLDFYGEPFAASGRYGRIGELVAARTRLRRVYGTDGTTVAIAPDGSYRVSDGAAQFTLRNRDFNVQSFRSNLVLRWEWRPGSTLYLVWQQDREYEVTSAARASAGDMFRSFGRSGDNFFALKATFWVSR